ncbi:hypothetical protein [Hymenobacter cellulosivorans]|uniref:Uncharacterized protein n=1 Tax=Hymenobacter cellulosivorans TaxID=2932249 RepID=A0ABY4FFA5_9BACT|nr:hypothetical protein [Hymenobacter cellulosivorans]UOQ54629.1 hypothetical protein MUN80_07660 [Hymenobacter cellulosivorans]
MLIHVYLSFFLSAACMKINFSCLLLLALLGLSHCKKKEATPEDQLPPATQTGQNTAGCRVDGIAWTAQASGLFSPKPIYAYWLKSSATSEHALNLRFNKRTDDMQVHAQTSIEFFVPNLRAAGTFLLNQSANPMLASTNPPYGAFEFGKRAPDQVLLTGPSATGQLVITRFDSVARVVAGTFEFTAREASGAATVQVSEGRFDCKF